jgi:2-oxoglutarate ferredoxin oxidoreductase subunit gamma
LINKTLVQRKAKRSDIKLYEIPTAELAAEVGVPKGANMVMLGALLEATGWVPYDIIYENLVKTFKGRYLDKMPANMKCIEAGMEYLRRCLADVPVACGQ